MCDRANVKAKLKSIADKCSDKGLTEEDIQNKFEFLVNAFKYGTPPHGGLALGLDRLVMLLTKNNNLREVIAFPKAASAKCLMSNCPTPVADSQLDELKIKVNE